MHIVSLLAATAAVTSAVVLAAPVAGASRPTLQSASAIDAITPPLPPAITNSNAAETEPTVSEPSEPTAAGDAENADETTASKPAKADSADESTSEPAEADNADDSTSSEPAEADNAENTTSTEPAEADNADDSTSSEPAEAEDASIASSPAEASTAGGYDGYDGYGGYGGYGYGNSHGTRYYKKKINNRRRRVLLRNKKQEGSQKGESKKFGNVCVKGKGGFRTISDIFPHRENFFILTISWLIGSTFFKYKKERRDGAAVDG
jgi:hypothetical protein